MNNFKNLRLLTDADFECTSMPIRGFGDMPIGSPHGGPASGRLEMPIFAGIAAAFATVGSAVAAGSVAAGVAAAGSGLAFAGAVATVVGTVATVVGMTMTVVGAITGDQDLMEIGGYVSLAGGVTGLAGAGLTAAGQVGVSAATTSAGTATAATPAASEGAAGGAAGGLTGASGNAMINTVTPAFQSGAVEAAGSLGAMGSATTGSVAGSASALGNAGATALQGITPVASAAGTGFTTAAESTVAGVQSATDVATQSGSFFDELMKPQSLVGIAKIGADTLKGSAIEDMQNKLLDQKTAVDTQKLQFEQNQYNTKMVNANTQGRLGLLARAPTPAEIAANNATKAQSAKNMARILTAPAGL